MSRARAHEPPTALCIHLLGQFRVGLGGRAVAEGDWPLRKARSLVKLLALVPGARLEREQIMDLLWPELPPQASANNLRYALHVARRALARVGDPGGGPILVGEGRALALRPPGPLWIDVAAFEEAAAAARRAPTPASYAAALDLYAGDLLPDDRYEDWATTRREALRDLALNLRLELAGLHEGAGAWHPAIAALEPVLAAEPAHEEAHLALMRLYALAGQRALALRQWDALVAALHRHLDAEPATESRGLRDEIAAGRFPPAAPGVGGRRGRPRGNLPVPLTPLIGREGDRLAIKDALAGARLLTLTGPGGSGKTRLALAVGTELAAASPGGAWQVDLTALDDPALLARGVADALALPPRAGRDTVAGVVDALRDRAVLLLLDNCEHLIGACAALTAALLAGCPSLRLLATSREPLGVPGEVVWPVPPLALPPPGAAGGGDLGALGCVAAVRLFVERARGRRPTFALTADNAAAVAEICRRLDGIPLALELAAARVGVLSPAQLVARLDDALGTLAPRQPGVAGRQATLRATLDWSYALLTDPERAIFARLAACANGWTLEAAEALGDAAGGDDPALVLDALAGLVDKSLIVAEERGATVRYRMLEIVRQYAAALLAAGGEEGAVRRRHLAYYLGLATAIAPTLRGPAQGAGFDRLAAEHENLRLALRTALATDPPAALRLGGALWRFWYVRGHVDEGRGWLRALLALPRAPDEAAAPDLLAARAAVAYGAGALAVIQNDIAAGRAAFATCLCLRRATGDTEGIAQALMNLGFIAASDGAGTEAERLLAESVRLLRGLDNRGELATALNNLGFTRLLTGAYANADAVLEESIAHYRAAGHSWGLCSALNNLGNVRLELGDPAAALALQRQSLTLARREEARVGLLWGLEGAAHALGAEAAGAARAAHLYGAVEGLRRAIGYARMPAKAAYYERHLAAVRARLCPATFAAAWEAGLAAPLDAVLADLLAPPVPGDEQPGAGGR